MSAQEASSVYSDSGQEGICGHSHELLGWPGDHLVTQKISRNLLQQNQRLTCLEHQTIDLVADHTSCDRVGAASGLTPVHASNTSGMERSQMQQNIHEKRFLSPAELAARWEHRVCVRTMANWRTQGNGPRFTKIGGRVLYPLKDVEAWEHAGTVDSTAQYFRGPGVLPPAKPKQRSRRIVCPGEVVSITKTAKKA